MSLRPGLSDESTPPAPWPPRAGDWVEVRPVPEILATLDRSGDKDALPFMPEMLRFSGRRFPVSAVAHKTCDTVNRTGGRRMRDAVHLADLRCDGSAHGGCQAECLLFWKLDWLRPSSRPDTPAGQEPLPTGFAEPATTRLAVTAGGGSDAGSAVYRCQATRLFAATEPLHWWDVRQYWRDVRTGNVTWRHALTTLLLACIYNLRRLPVGYRVSCWLYDRVHRLLRNQPDPHPVGSIPRGQATPDERLNLALGEVVEIRSKSAIEATLNTGNRNRGLSIDAEMTSYCGQQRRVVTRVERIINEQTGEMMHFKNPCIVLEGVHCMGEYSDRRLLCPRRITTYWREIWLRRAASASGSDNQAGSAGQ